jgi:hypothetical protein
MESTLEYAHASLPADIEQTYLHKCRQPMLAGIRARRIILLPAFPARSASGHGEKAECRSIPFADRCGGSAGSECQCIWPAPPCFPLN